MVNYVWAALIFVSLFVGGLLGTYGGENGMVESLFSSAKAGVNLAIGLAGPIMLWLGLMKLAERAGLISILARLIAPVLRPIFRDVPADHPAMGAMIMNMAANMIGAGNAATPLGLKAMEELNKINPHKGVATNAMCTFLAINTSSVTIIPATAIAVLASANVATPQTIIPTAIMATLVSTTVAILGVKTLEKLPLFAVRPLLETAEPAEDDIGESTALVRWTTWRRVLAWCIPLMIATFFFFDLKPAARQGVLEFIGGPALVEQVETLKNPSASVDAEENRSGTDEKGILRLAMEGLANNAIPFVLLFFVGYAMLRGIPVFETFVDGAKEGFSIAVRIMPFLVGMIVAMGMFRDSGALLLLKATLGKVLAAIGFPIDLLPLAVMRPLSGGGSQGILAEIVSNPSITDSVKYTAGTMFGSTETTLYVLAVYFGSVAVRRSRHALVAGLLADASGVAAAVIIGRLFFG